MTERQKLISELKVYRDYLNMLLMQMNSTIEDTTLEESTTEKKR